MDSKMIVERYGAKNSKPLLWDDHDLTLRKTEFKATGDWNFDRQTLVHWWMNVYVPNGQRDEETPYEVYKTWSSAVGRYFPFAKAGGGYNPKTDQSAVEICTYKNFPVEPQLNDLQLWLPHLKPIEEDGRSYQYLGIFEHTLSEGGVFFLRIYSETDVALWKTTYGHSRLLRSFPMLQEAVLYVSKNHWYEKEFGGYDEWAALKQAEK
jgi:hypothetical protein